MTTKLNVEMFIAVLRKSGLIERDRLEEALKELTEAADGKADPLPLVDRLIGVNLITKWQAEKLLQGKHRGYFLGKYKLLSLLGKGGMSTVYLAEHLVMKRRCALKVLPAKRVDDSSYFERFHREAQAVASLNHPNIVQAYDVDHQADGDRQIHFLVMEHVDGADLQEIVTSKGVLSFMDAAEYTRQAAAGLQNAHEHGMIHRDIKPGNVLVDQHGVVKVLDLGLARFFTSDEGMDALTLRYDEKVLGTADYLAPEQALDSHTVDVRADIYSLGCTLYFMLTGQPPFSEGTLAQRLMAHQVKTPPTVESLRPDTPASLSVILRKMMEKRASDRYQTAGELEKALFHWIDQNADAEWRTAHSGLYGSRPSQSDGPRREIPVAQPVIAKVVQPATANVTVSTQPAKPLSSKTKLPKTDAPNSSQETDAAISQFFTSLSQADTDSKRTDAVISTSRKSLGKSSSNQPTFDIKQPAPASTSISNSSSSLPAFDTIDFSRSATMKATDPLRSSSSHAIPVKRSSASLKAVVEVWKKLTMPVKVGVCSGSAIILLLVLYLSFLSGPPKPPPPDPLKDKREVTVGKKGEYSSIREVLAAVKKNFKPKVVAPEQFVVRILPGTYEENLQIDGSVNPWPEGIVLRGDGDVVITSHVDEPVIRLNTVSRFKIENIQIDAKDRPVAIEVSKDLDETQLTKLVVRGFSNVGVLCKGAQGLGFANKQFVLDQVTFEPSGSQAVAVKLEDDPLNDVNSVLIRGCRFLSPMAAGVVIEGRSPYGIDVSECIFNKTTDGVRIEGQPLLKGIRFINNSFRQVKHGIRLARLPNGFSTDLMLRRNLFTGIEVAEVLVQDDYDEEKFRTILSSNPPGFENNWSDRQKPLAPIKGEAEFLIQYGRQGEGGFAFVSTNPKTPRFLAPKEKSPQEEVPGAQLFEKPWVGAVGNK